MSMFVRFTPQARRSMVRAGLLAVDAGRPHLDEDVILLALAETRPFERPLDGFDLDAETVRAAVASQGGDQELLAALGIDLEEVRRRMSGLTRADDPARWTLRRSRWRPLRVTLSGPVHDLPLTGRARKVVEVAMNRRAARRVTGEDLMCGLLADSANRSVRIMRASGVDLRRLAAGLGFLRRAA
ncbi:Clp protease N-terminal domain-containing protein [Sphaerisporangium rhizosphaerae]|uniref:Clp protease N-terminal domain-containing protein n=1 Tax=Sphaerisporangium rhizosphaerae TaxID=2269375 RepID=A0ABW2NZS0_9ACTN